MAAVKCQYCGEKEEKNKMAVVEEKKNKNGRITRKYCHPHCVEKYQEEKAFKEKERKAFDELIEVIKEVHGLEIIPPNFYPYLQQLRNGTNSVQNREGKYKEGYTYELIVETYKYCRDKIAWAKQNKSFDSTFNELKYCWFIICNKINYVKQLFERDKIIRRAEERIEHETNNINIEYIEYNCDEIERKKPKRKDEVDISDFL